MSTYRTSEIAAAIGIHPNTVRLYEELELIPKPERLPNGYRIFTEFHLEQFRLARLAFQIEILQNGLRKKIVEVVKTSAKGEFDAAIALVKEYSACLQEERCHAEEAIRITKEVLSGKAPENAHAFKRREASEYLGISMDTLRNWEMNGLITVKRKQNGYRVYTDEDIRRLKVIRSLRCANYSLSAILRMFKQLEKDPEANIKKALNIPRPDSEIISVCDELIASLSAAEYNAVKILRTLKHMKTKY